MWQDAISVTDLAEKGRKVIKLSGRQIVLFHTGQEILACNNRCPHQGYPLMEGNLSGEKGCILTCNWHNWKFDLQSGETLIGGDKLRRYPVRVDGDRVLLDLTDPPTETVISESLANLIDCFDQHEYDRMAREVARLIKAGGDPLEALRRTIAVTANRFEYGATHALPATADWLSLRDGVAEDPVRALAMLIESIGHFVWDSLREPEFPFPEGQADWDEEGFVAAIETEDEATAVRFVRGAIAAGLGWSDIERGFARAALAHYADFGHSAIYTYKMRALTDHLGDADSLRHLCLMLTRSLVYATREDLIPEFRSYGPALENWKGDGQEVPSEESLRKGSVRGILAALSAGSTDPAALYEVSMAAGAWQMLHFDLAWQDKTDSTISQDVGWLDFTHTLTFGNAARKLAERYPELWPNALLQIGCFLGRNAGYTDPDIDEAPWRSNDPVAAVAAALNGVEDHGRFEYIVSSHLLKLSYAIDEEMRDMPDQPRHATSAAALTRFLNSPLKRKHTLRVAHQALDFVQAEG